MSTRTSARRAEELFLELSAAPAAVRARLLRERTEGDAPLRAEVGDLLGFHDRAEGFLDADELMRHSLGFAAPATPDDVPLSPHRRLGEYTIKGVLGSGGMGVVYVAEQERPRRTVALKVIRRAAASPSLIRRFEHEAEILGRLQHPGIAQIFEAGAADAGDGDGAQPYIAMELIDGVSLTAHAEAKGLSTRERLALVVKVCDAVHHAHQRGVIHRDLKPGNILVDRSGQPKVLDFGVARAVDADLRVTTVQTSVGQLIGTLPYMSPEQVAADPAEIDIRSDVYALGVILYQLLTGKLPYDVRSRSIPEAARVIRDEAPARLSAVSKVFRGEVEIIVAKAIEKDKARRYQSAADLGADLERHLAGQPIAARQDSAFYVLRKQIRRYRGWVAAASACVIALVAFSIYAGVQADRSRVLAAAETDARVEAVIAREAADRGRADAIAGRLEADAQRRRADGAALRLAGQLRDSTIDRGRLLARTGSLSLAETLLWPEHLASPDPFSYWALWEVYNVQPCIATFGPLPVAMTEVVWLSESTIAVASLDGVVRIWDVRAGSLLREIVTGDARVESLTVVDRGRSLLTVGNTGYLRSWDLRTGALVTEWEASERPLFVVSASPDGRTIATGGEDARVRLWDLPTGRLVHALAQSGARAATFTRDASTIAVGGVDGVVRVYDVVTGGRVRTLATDGGTLGAIAFSPDGAVMVTGSIDRHLRVWDAATGALLRTIPCTVGSIRSVSFSQDGTRVASAGWFGTVLHDPRDWSRLGDLKGAVHRLAFGPGPDASVATTSGQGATSFIRVWQPSRNAALTAISTPHPGVGAVAFNPARPLLATGSQAGVIDIRDAAGAPLRTFSAHRGPLVKLAWAPDGLHLASSAREPSVKVWDADRGECVADIPGPAQGVNGVAFAPDGRALVLAARDRTVRVWDWTTRTHRFSTPPLPNEIVWVGVDPASTVVASLSRPRRVDLWDLATGANLATWTASADVWTGCFSPDGLELLVGDWEYGVEVWDLATRRQAARLTGHAQLITGVTHILGGDVIVASAVDGTILLWDRATGRNLARLQGDIAGDALRSIDIAPDGRTLAAGYGDGTLGLWDLAHCDRHIEGNRDFQQMLAARAGAPGRDGPEPAGASPSP